MKLMFNAYWFHLWILNEQVKGELFVLVILVEKGKCIYYDTICRVWKCWKVIMVLIIKKLTFTKVFLSEGNSEIGAHEIEKLTCSMHLFKSILLLLKDISYAQRVLSHHLTLTFTG